jgi:hypothetical protein
MTKKQPKAIQLADWTYWFLRDVKDPEDFRWKHMADTAAELRRLHTENQELNHKLADYASAVEHLLHCSHEDGAEILRLREENERLVDVLKAALPFVEDVNGNSVFKVARATAMAGEILEVVAVK